MNHILQALIPLLPRYPEEGNEVSRVNKQTIEATLIASIGNEQTQAVQTTVALVENLLISLCLLDNEEQQRGEWKFLSHPAQLCALSLLNTLADPRQKLCPSNFWSTSGEIPDDDKQKQKAVLQALEDARYAHHLDGSEAVPPIRFIYVAWGIIKLDDKIICHQREAAEHKVEYGFVGGRARASDLKKILGEEVANQTLLDTLQAPHSAQILQTLEHTLYRECEEEVKLLQSAEHYQAHLWRELKPYIKCMGGAPNYALTHYFFRLYQIKLSTIGYFALRAQMQDNDKLIECTLDEVANGKTADDAKKLTIQAIYDDFG